MQIVAVELMAKLRDAIEAIGDHLSGMDSVNLQALEKRLPRNPLPGSAEMVMLLLVSHEMDSRKR
ncbi:hypothetical protein RFM41_03290 [Mesorhizobium sp. VK25A]|uniref:Uncharacterized protein n=1 Tax=Mesorhizobium vachelliae TaxID=3072309 RepID=A0ABU4ZZB1_9HYPH|nr:MULTISPECIES: hypothetical protein [unclassified Mesorhizobium]MDX8530765.1 hypothetical protein [Mesorhizobium sp. VK25D]MDX8542742.1 hypothetical protein [Mesorhizobium sp. VK25A]